MGISQEEKDCLKSAYELKNIISHDFTTRNMGLTRLDFSKIKLAVNKLIDSKKALKRNAPDVELFAKTMLAKTLALIMIGIKYDIRIFKIAHRHFMDDRAVKQFVAMHDVISNPISFEKMQSQFAKSQEDLDHWVKAYPEIPSKTGDVKKLVELILGEFQIMKDNNLVQNQKSKL